MKEWRRETCELRLKHIKLIIIRTKNIEKYSLVHVLAALNLQVAFARVWPDNARKYQPITAAHGMHIASRTELSILPPTDCYAFHKFICTYHVVWGYYYILLLTILVRCNGKHFFAPAEKKIKCGELGHRKEKWDKWWGRSGTVSVISLQPSILEIKRIINTCKWVQTVYVHIHHSHPIYKEGDTYVEKWDTHGEKLIGQ